jgi:glycerophosphoryl diester phosphodiesterase
MAVRPWRLWLGTLVLLAGWQPGSAVGQKRAVLPEIIAHRGASHDAPENTLAAVNLAWQRKAKAVEIDIYLSRDKRIVVYHDKTTKRIGGRDRAVKDQTLAELQQLDVGSWKSPRYKGERVPTLQDVLETVPPGGRLFIEIKAGVEIVPHVVAMLEQWRHTPKRAVVIAFSFEVATAMKNSMPGIPVYWLVSFEQSKQDGSWEPNVDSVVSRAKQAGLDGINTNYTPLLTRELVARVHAEGLGYYVWTVNDPGDARILRQIGIDGITTDRPAWLRQQMRRDAIEPGS